MHSEIPRETLHEILRKLTPAIGRVLAKRRKLYSCNANPVQGHGCEQCRIDREYNSHLEQVLDHDIVEAVVMMGLCLKNEFIGFVIDGIDYEVAYIDASFIDSDESGEVRIAWTIGDQDHEHTVAETDLPALVAEAWAK